MFFFVLMVCFVVYPRKSQFNHAFEWMHEIGEKFGLELVLKFDDELFSERYLPQYVFMRGYNFELSRWFEIRGVYVINSSASMALSLDKWRSHLAFTAKGVAVPRTILGSNNTNYSYAKKTIGYDKFIIKGLFGQKGEQVWLVGSDEEYNAATTKLNGEDFLIQEFIESSLGRDIRVWVVGGKAVCAVVRENSNSFKSNISAGGRATKFNLTKEVQNLAITATHTVGLDIAGVDILFGGDKGYLVCEINGNAGFRSAVATGQDFVLEHIIKYLYFYIPVR